MSLASALYQAISPTVPIIGVEIGNPADKTTWRVQPASLQAQAQPIIDAFDASVLGWELPDADAEIDALFDGAVGNIVEAFLENFGAMQAEAQASALRVSIWEQRLRRRAKVLRRAATST